LVLSVGALWWLAGPVAQPSAEEIKVDLALVLGVDVSRSMDIDEQELQRQGFVEAFRAQAVHETKTCAASNTTVG
jgi:hypothetical protein